MPVKTKYSSPFNVTDKVFYLLNQYIPAGEVRVINLIPKTLEDVYDDFRSQMNARMNPLSYIIATRAGETVFKNIHKNISRLQEKDRDVSQQLELTVVRGIFNVKAWERFKRGWNSRGY
jgi:hypothetical protein